MNGQSHHYAGHYPNSGPKQNVIKPAPKRLALGDMVLVKSRNSLYYPVDEPTGRTGGPLPKSFDGLVARVIELPPPPPTETTMRCGPLGDHAQWALQIATKDSEHFGVRLDIGAVVFIPMHPLEILALGFEE